MAQGLATAASAPPFLRSWGLAHPLRPRAPTPVVEVEVITAPRALRAESSPLPPVEIVVRQRRPQLASNVLGEAVAYDSQGRPRFRSPLERGLLVQAVV